MLFVRSIIVCTTLFLASCAGHLSSSNPSPDPYQPKPYVTLTHPAWSKNAVIYELNTRQFSQEGTFKGAQKQLDRLKNLGVDIIWLMPINPIGKENRKGPMGSPYSVKDYFAVNPEFGTLADLKDFVNAAHKRGMKVILDWVANHTAWDNVIRFKHPDWYAHDYKGDFRPTSWWDWSDIIDLDYSKPGLRKYMTDAMKYWVKVADIDGYRCDVAGFVPVDFWNNVRRELDQIKPVFMLAEWESRDLHAKAFDMTYAWSWREHMVKIAQGKEDVSGLFVYYSWNENAFPREAYRMTYASNHDTNAWEGTQFETFGDALPAVIALSVIGQGFPLLYNGQEAGNKKRLAFFKRDPIHWQHSPIGDLYKTLFAMHKKYSALWNGQFGAVMQHVPNNQPKTVLSFIRQDKQAKIFAVFNFSAKPQKVTFSEPLFVGHYQDGFSHQSVVFDKNTMLTLKPWDFRVYIQTN